MNSTGINTSEKRASCFGPFRYDWEQRLLFREGETVPLAPKVGETLRVLLERHGTVVEKAELMRAVWPDTTVEEIGLARNISQLRKALGDESEAGKYIETLPKRGYRFVGEVVRRGRRTAERRGEGGRGMGTAGSRGCAGGGGGVRGAGGGLLAVLPAFAVSFIGRRDCEHRGYSF